MSHLHAAAFSSALNGRNIHRKKSPKSVRARETLEASTDVATGISECHYAWHSSPLPRLWITNHTPPGNAKHSKPSLFGAFGAFSQIRTQKNTIMNIYDFYVVNCARNLIFRPFHKTYLLSFQESNEHRSLEQNPPTSVCPWTKLHTRFGNVDGGFTSDH